MTTMSVVEKWETEQLYPDGIKFFNSVIKEIKQAKKIVLIETHIFDTKRLGRLVYEALLRAAKRGVKIFLIIDGFGSPDFKAEWKRKLMFHGAKIKVFNPLPWVTFNLNNLVQLNNRLHKKSCIIDNNIAYLGSYNIDSEQVIGDKSWKDIGIRVTGKPIKNIINSFWNVWALREKKVKKLPIKSSYGSLVKSNYNDELRIKNFKALINRIKSAKKNISIVTPYFVPNVELLEALKLAARKGVKVDIILPKNSDIHLFPLVNAISCKSLIGKNLNIYEFGPKILHAKITMIDSWFMVGSSNMNMRTIKHDLELDILPTHENTKQEIRNYIKELKNDSEFLDYEALLDRFSFKKYLLPVLKQITYWL
jgi:cardiolipin synthase A/B